MQTQRYFQSNDGLRLHVREFGTVVPDRPSLVCVAGLTRNSRDYTDFAEECASLGWHVLAFDPRGRGYSDWDPQFLNYNIDTYVGDVLTFIDSENISEIVFAGYSMGALIAFRLSSRRPGLVRAIIDTDIGPEVDDAVIEQGILPEIVSQYIAKDWTEAVDMTKLRYDAGFPAMSDDWWHSYARRAFREWPDKTIRSDYDPKIGESGRQIKSAHVHMWEDFKALEQSMPLLVLKGETSALLSQEIVDRMRAIHPEMRLVTVKKRGHTDLHNEPEGRAAALSFLDEYLASRCAL